MMTIRQLMATITAAALAVSGGGCSVSIEERARHYEQMRRLGAQSHASLTQDGVRATPGRCRERFEALVKHSIPSARRMSSQERQVMEAESERTFVEACSKGADASSPAAATPGPTAGGARR